MAENEDNNVPKKKNLDYILDNLVGGGSWYQWTTLLAMAPLWISEWPMTVSPNFKLTHLQLWYRWSLVFIVW